MIIKTFPDLKLLNPEQIKKVHEASVHILEEIGVQVNHDEILNLLREKGAKVDIDQKNAKLPESLVMDSVKRCKKVFSLYGRDSGKQALIRHGHAVFESSSGQYSWIETSVMERRYPVLEDARKAIRLADALEEIDIVGAFVVPRDVPIEVKDVYLARELVRYTTKPCGLWMNNGETANYVLKVFEIAVGGVDTLREKPITEAYVEPVSPLRFSRDSLEILIEFAKRGLPVCFGPVPMTMATAPTTPVGTIVIANAEILAGVVMAQLLQPGMPVAYWGAQQTMDAVTSNVSFASPAQGMMAASIVQIGQYYGFPVSSTVAFSDSNYADNQSGVERAATLLIAILAGCNICGHIGIWGGDQGASLVQLVLDNEMMSYLGAMLREIKVDDETLAFEVVKRVGIGGHFLDDEHTLRNFRKELWFPKIYNRDSWEVWAGKGKKTVLERAEERVEKILQDHKPKPLDPDVEKEINVLVEEAKQKIVTKNKP